MNSFPKHCGLDKFKSLINIYESICGIVLKFVLYSLNEKAKYIFLLNIIFLFSCLVPVQFTTPPLNKTVNVTNPISLSCYASGFPAPSIKWTRLGKLLSSNKQLNIPRSDKDDAGEYMCTASNGVGQPKTAKSYVTVQCEFTIHHVIKLHVAVAAAHYPSNFFPY